MEDHKQEIKGLPDNAYRELKPGEEYKPVMPANKTVPEVNLRSVLLGLLMAVIFSAAAAYLGLKIGQVFEAAIPIAIIAVGLSTVSKRKNALGENVIIQSIGASSGSDSSRCHFYFACTLYSQSGSSLLSGFSFFTAWGIFRNSVSDSFQEVFCF